PDVDYAFEDFPGEIPLKNGKPVTKTRVVAADLKPYEAINATAMEPGRRTNLLPFLEAHLRVDPADAILLLIYSSFAGQSGQHDRSRAFLATRLDERPVLIEWHRAYQESCQAGGHEDELLALYDQFLETDPGNSALL